MFELWGRLLYVALRNNIRVYMSSHNALGLKSSIAKSGNHHSTRNPEVISIILIWAYLPLAI